MEGKSVPAITRLNMPAPETTSTSTRYSTLRARPAASLKWEAGDEDTEGEGEGEGVGLQGRVYVCMCVCVHVLCMRLRTEHEVCASLCSGREMQHEEGEMQR